MFVFFIFFLFKQKTAYEMRISDWSSDVCSSDLSAAGRARGAADAAQAHSFFSHLDTNIQRILAGFGTLRDLVTDVRASLADAAARDAQRAEDEEARDTAIAARLVDPA